MIQPKAFPQPARQPAIQLTSQPASRLDVREAVFNSLWLPQHNTADQAAIKMLIDSFIRTANQREGGGKDPNRNRFPTLLINSDGN